MSRTHKGGYDVDELGALGANWQNTETARVPDSPKNVRWLAERHVSWLRAEGTASGGGRLLVAQLTRREITVRDEGTL